MIQMPYFISKQCLKSKRLKALQMWVAIRNNRSGQVHIKDKVLPLISQNYKLHLNTLVELGLARKRRNGWYSIVGSRNYSVNELRRKSDYYFEITEEELCDLSLLRTRIYAASLELVTHRKGKVYTLADKREFEEKQKIELGKLPDNSAIRFAAKNNILRPEDLKVLFNPRTRPSNDDSQFFKEHKRSELKTKYRNRANQKAESAKKPTTGLATDCALSYIQSFTGHGTKSTWSKQRAKADKAGILSHTRDMRVIKVFKSKPARDSFYKQVKFSLLEAHELELVNKVRKHNQFGAFAVVQDESSIVWASRMFVKKRYRTSSF